MTSNVVAIEVARARRVARASEKEIEIRWFINQAAQQVIMPLRQRVRLATEFVRSRVVQNISRPVTKTVVTRVTKDKTLRDTDFARLAAGKEVRERVKKVQQTVVSDRSKPGEFPKADTTQLMKTVFTDVHETLPGVIDGYVGTPLGYGVILETRMQRQFLTRTLREEAANVTAILTGPIR